jgi:glutamate/tyrosine decarboxylase-like PLP-dependent enzyme
MLTRTHKSPGFLSVRHHADSTLSVGNYDGIPNISGAPVALPSAWFIGPRGENTDLMAAMAAAAIEHIRVFRDGYQAGDPVVITDEIKASPQYQESVATMSRNFTQLLGYLRRRSTPFHSLRYQAHMLWDNTIPALAGYFAGMLHNPNNVTIQASTSTTLLEMLVMRDLCHTIGWPTETNDAAWAHITADGSIANIEAVWAAREVKFLPFALRAAIEGDPRLGKAAAVPVRLTDGSLVPLLAADNWQLFNIRRDELLALPARVGALAGIPAYEVWGLVAERDVNAVGLLGMVPALQGLGGAPVILTPSTRHYSWPKAAAVNGFGTVQDRTVMVDADARMDIVALDAHLAECLKRRVPVLLAVAVLGSTEESAVDPLSAILVLRDRYRMKGLEFDIHVDAAWGGYVITTVRRDFDWGGGDLADPFIPDTRGVPLSDYTIEQFQAMRRADSATIDPHKSGYIQYPAGAVLYRNKEVVNLTTFTGAYIGAASDPTVGMFGLEGSKPGAAAAAVFFSHMCIRPSVSGYGRILSYALANAKQLYVRLLFMARPGDPFACTPLARLPAERHGGDAAAELRFIEERLLGRATEEIDADPAVMALFRELGPDQNIVDYGFNALVDGRPSPDIERYNALVQAVYDAFHVHYNQKGEADDVHRYPLLLTITTFSRTDYGDAFMDTFAARLGLVGRPERLNCLRSVVMDPYVSDTTMGSFFDVIIGILRAKVTELALGQPG